MNPPRSLLSRAFCGLPFALLLTGAGVAVAAETPVELRFSSGPDSPALLELYTSEGCSSCPPAERWLAGLRDDPRLWREFVPVAFHVNYWDRLGWRDRFASREFTQREYAYSAAWKSDSVYTPCFVRDGREWRRDRDSLAVARSADARGTLELQQLPDENRWRVRFSPAGKPSDTFSFTAVLLGGGIVSDVKSGENSGRTLAHEFVALTLRTTPLVQTADGDWTAEFELQDSRTAELPRLAIAGWITRASELTPRFSLGGWIRR